VNVLAFDPNHPATLYAGSAYGGVWKSLDRGGSWFPMSDHKGLPTLGVGALAVAADGTVYVGTGDPNPGADSYFQYGRGVYKSGDGGVTWQPAGTTVDERCPQESVAFTGQARRILVDPHNANVVYVAANEGLFRSMNAGGCWQRLLGLVTGITDIAMDPLNTTTLYVATPNFVEGLWKTTDAKAPFPHFVPFMHLPVSTTYKVILLAVAPSAPATVYAAFSVDDRSDIIRSTDGGQTWQQRQSRCSFHQCAYDTAVAISPTDPDQLVYADVKASLSTDGGQSWRSIGSGHDDFHALTFAPDNPQLLYAATDGGVYRITVSSGQGWEPRNLGLVIAQSNVLALAPTNSQAAAIGVWDNGTQRRLAGRSWQQIWGGDGFNAAIDAASDQTIYYNYNACGCTRHGSEFDRYPGGAMIGSADGYLSNPYRPGELFAVGPNGTSNSQLYVSEETNTQSPASWHCADPNPTSSRAFSLEFSPDGSFYLSRQDGTISHFTLSLSPTSVVLCGPGKTAAQNVRLIFVGPPPANGGSPIIPRLALDPFNPQSIYVVLPGASTPQRVLRLSQINSKWTLTPLAATLDTSLTLTGAIGADPRMRGEVYVGTTNGLYVGILQGNGTYSWGMNTDVPDTYITGIVAQRNSQGYSGILRVDTFGRGVWERLSGPHRCQPVGVTISCWPDTTTVHCLSCPSSPSDFAASQRNPSATNGAAWLAIPYDYRGEAGPHAFVRVAMLSHGKELPFFFTQDQQVGIGQGSIVVKLMYAANNPPLGVHTDAIRYELLAQPNGPIITSTTVPFDRWWLRPEARLLMLDAEGINQDVGAHEEGGDATSSSIPIPLTVQIGQRPVMRGNAPLSLPIVSGTKVTIQVASAFKTDQGTLYFSQWVRDSARTGTQAAITLTLTENTTLTASYTTTRPPPPPGSGLPGWLQIVLLLLLLVALSVLMWIIVSRFRRRPVTRAPGTG